MDFSFKYLQKRNIRKEKQPSSPARYRSLARINTPFTENKPTHPIPIQNPILWPILNANTIPSVARYRSTPSVIPKSKDKAALRHHSPLKEKTPPTPTRDTNRRILSPYPLSLKRGNSQISKTVLSTAAMPHQP